MDDAAIERIVSNDVIQKFLLISYSDFKECKRFFFYFGYLIVLSFQSFLQCDRLLSDNLLAIIVQYRWLGNQ